MLELSVDLSFCMECIECIELQNAAAWDFSILDYMYCKQVILVEGIYNIIEEIVHRFSSVESCIIHRKSWLGIGRLGGLTCFKSNDLWGSAKFMN